MTHVAERPIQLTLESMLARFRDKHPALVEPFERLRLELERGEGAQGLANLIGCEVEAETNRGLSVYRWQGHTGRFEMQVPGPFDPQLQQQVQAEDVPASSPWNVGELADEPEPRTDVEPPPEVAEAVPAPVLATTPGLFAALSALLGDTTLLMTVARTGEADGEPLLSVTVVPQADLPGLTPVCLEGSAAELDAHIVAALTAKAEGKQRIEVQIEALKAADKALEEAKKVEVTAKNKQVDAKKKGLKDKEGQEKAEAQKVEPAPEAPQPQAALF